MRNANSMKMLSNSDLFPSMKDLIGIERTYSDSLRQEDLTGIKEDKPKFKKQQRKKFVSLDQTSGHTTAHLGQSFATGTSKIQEESEQHALSKTQQNNTILLLDDAQQTLKDSGNQKNLRSRSLGQTSKIISKETYTIRMRKIPQQQQLKTPCYIYSSQSLNYYEQQKELLREQIRKHPNNFYTYSTDYLSLSIDPFDPNVAKHEEQKKEKLRLSQKKPFVPLPKRSYIETIKPTKQLPQSKVDELRNSQWWVERTRVQDLEKQTISESLKALAGKEKFSPKVKGVKYFSEPQIYEAEKITAVEKEKVMKAEKQKEYEQWKSKLFGQQNIYTYNVNRFKDSQLDKLKGLLANPPMKSSLILSPSKLAQSSLAMTKTLEPTPASMYINQEYEGPVRDILRETDNAKAVSNLDFQRYSRINPQNESIVSKIVKQVSECS